MDKISVKLRWSDHYKYSPQLMHVSRPSNPHSIFWIILGGNRELSINNITYELSEGDLVCIPPHCQRTDLSITGDKDMEYLVVGCDFKIGSFNLLDWYRFPVVSTVMDSEDWEQIQRLWYQLDVSGRSLLHEFITTDDPTYDESQFKMLNVHQTLINLRINAILSEWLEIIMKNVMPVIPVMHGLPNVIDERINRACSYIDTHLAEKLTIKILADHSFLSQSQFQLLFRKSLGISPMKYIQQQRFEYASQLLLSTNKAIREIGQSIGFDDQRHFSIWYKQACGLSPTQYRQQWCGPEQGHTVLPRKTV
ncbi:helix-turn-helix domain-containing protein [Paenibacillus sp. LMG 31456]|uniref:Helix-turn-helix domain-containing protein n=1 Tax=Paenibacillus foliorum TaxID=2654974 RepID=A0A972GNT0_9BACL|nr:AraC family transcriptional regulator [Paenibacillus foliorum]NOU94084.1 helix-turn-helix domain-containing protein [Paenibacillus foliorum]